MELEIDERSMLGYVINIATLRGFNRTEFFGEHDVSLLPEIVMGGPERVLNTKQQEMVDRLLSSKEFISCVEGDDPEVVESIIAITCPHRRLTVLWEHVKNLSLSDA